MGRVAGIIMSPLFVVKGQNRVLSRMQTDAICDGPGQSIEALLLEDHIKLFREQQNTDLRFRSFFSLCEDEPLRHLDGRTAT